MARRGLQKSKDETDKRGRSGGKAGSLGYEFQSVAIAWLYVQLLEGRSAADITRLIPIGPASPMAVSAETGSSGDDIVVAYANGTSLEVQVRRGLRVGSRLFDPLTRLAKAIDSDPSMAGAIICDQTSSERIRQKLKEDLCRIAQGRVDDLSELGIKVIKKLAVLGIDASKVAGRLAIIEVSDAEPASLRHLLADPQLSGHAWAHLRADAQRTIGMRGRRDTSALLSLLKSRNIAISTDSASYATYVQEYTRWRQQSFATFTVLGHSKALPVESCIPLRVYFRNSSSNAEVVPNTRGPVETYYGYQNADRRLSETYAAEYGIDFNRRVVLVGGPGSGKTLLLQRIAHRLVLRSLVVLHVRLRDVAALRKDGIPLEEAILRLSFDGFGRSEGARRELLETAWALLADGLDECGVAAEAIARELIAWSHGHDKTRLLVTTRPVGFHEALFQSNSWGIGILLPLDERRATSNVRYILYAMGTATNQIPSSLLRSVVQPNSRTSQERSANRLRSPLFLAVCASLVAGGIDPPETEAGLLHVILNRFRQRPATGRGSEPPHSQTFCDQVLELAGALLRDDLSIPHTQLVENIASHISGPLGRTQLDSASSVEQALAFWEERALLERLHAGDQTYLAFAHLQLCEAAAADYRKRQSKTSRAEFVKWSQQAVTQAAQNEVLRLLAEDGSLLQVVQALLEDRPDYVVGRDLIVPTLELIGAIPRSDDILDGSTRLIIEERLLAAIGTPGDTIADKCAGQWLDLPWRPKASFESLQAALLVDSHPRKRLRGWALKLSSDLGNASEEFLGSHFGWEFQLPRPPAKGIMALALADPLFDRCVATAAPKVMSLPRSGERLAILKKVAEYKQYGTSTAYELDELAKAYGYEVNFSGQTPWGDLFPKAYMSESHAVDVWFLSVLQHGLRSEAEADLTVFPDAVIEEFRELGAIWSALGLDHLYVGEHTLIANEDHRIGLEAAVEGLTRNLGLDRTALAVECARVKPLLSEETGGSLGSQLPDVPVNSVSPLHNIASGEPLPARTMINGLFHPFRGIALAAGNLLDSGLIRDDLSVWIDTAQYPYQEHTCYLVAELAHRIWGPRAPQALVGRLQAPLVRGSHYFAEKLLDSYGGSSDSLLKDLVIRGIVVEDPYDAASFASLLARFDSVILDSASLRQAFDHWIANQKGIPPNGELSYESALVPLTRLLASRRQLLSQDLLALSKIDRTDVQKAARAENSPPFTRLPSQAHRHRTGLSRR